jgi:cellulose synthase/poly-beta-1,6-N-acetylglucosamine synthase-like glycosyltransferase
MIVPTFFQQLYSLLALRSRKRAKLRIRGRFAPTIDVFITCFKEDITDVLDTTRVALTVDYPLDRFRVVVLDDGASPELEKAIDDLRRKHLNLFYYARLNIDGVPDGGKSGNLNAGSGFVLTLDGGAGEFMAVLDADMVPEEAWLNAMVPHFVSRPKMSLVSTPKVYFAHVPHNTTILKRHSSFIISLTMIPWCRALITPHTLWNPLKMRVVSLCAQVAAT